MSNHEWTLTDTNQSRENHGFETRSFPRSLAATHRGFSFYLANPISSIHGYHGLGSAHGSRAYFGGLTKTVFYFTTQNMKLKEIFESGKQDEKMRHELPAFVLERNAPIT